MNEIVFIGSGFFFKTQPTESFNLETESGDTITTESGQGIETEDAP